MASKNTTSPNGRQNVQRSNRDSARWIAGLLLLFVGVVFLAVILFFLFLIPEEAKFNLVHILLAAIVAGGLGNMIDRLRYDYVVDFISFVLIHFPVFNVADCYIVVATILLFILFLFVFKEQDLEFLSFKKSGSGTK